MYFRRWKSCKKQSTRGRASGEVIPEAGVEAEAPISPLTTSWWTSSGTRNCPSGDLSRFTYPDLPSGTVSCTEFIIRELPLKTMFFLTSPVYHKFLVLVLTHYIQPSTGIFNYVPYLSVPATPSGSQRTSLFHLKAATCSRTAAPVLPSLFTTNSPSSCPSDIPSY